MTIMENLSKGNSLSNSTITSTTDFLNKTLPPVSSYAPSASQLKGSINTGTKVGNLLRKGKGLVKDNMGQVLENLPTTPPPQSNSTLTTSIDAATDTAADMAVQAGGPLAMIGGAYKGLKALDSGVMALTGGEATVKNASTTGDKILNSLMFKYTPLGAINTIGKTSVQGSEADIASAVSSGGGYAASDATEEKEFGGLSRIFARKKVKNAKASTARVNQENTGKLLAQQSSQAQMHMAQNTSGDIANKNYWSQMGGLKTNLLAAKHGAKINPAKLRNLVNTAIQKHKSGGAVNVIPEGALHARKNNYEGDLGDQVTNKGIPVITYEEGNKIIQHAEIEHSEIIFWKEVTDQLETWFKEYEKAGDIEEQNELAIKCGKFLTHEILENTQDNVGLINTIK